jgi:hypothetical protein
MMAARFQLVVDPHGDSPRIWFHVVPDAKVVKHLSRRDRGPLPAGAGTRGRDLDLDLDAPGRVPWWTWSPDWWESYRARVERAARAAKP